MEMVERGEGNFVLGEAEGSEEVLTEVPLGDAPVVEGTVPTTNERTDTTDTTGATDRRE